MTTYTIYASTTNGGYIESDNANAATCKAGSGFSVNDPTYGYMCFMYDGSLYSAFEAFWEFNTSVITDSPITRATLNCQFRITTPKIDTYQVRLFDFGASLTSADWRTPTQFAACTLLAHKAASAITDFAQVDFDDDAMAANLNTSGVTRMVAGSALFAADGTPGSGAYGYGYVDTSVKTVMPRLTVVAGKPPPYRAMMSPQRNYLRR
ncbi:MAG: hypothetical protein U1E23_14755 [Reyranellaceae bacterium]